jgi:hypothetical protein
MKTSRLCPLLILLTLALQGRRWQGAADPGPVMGLIVGMPLCSGLRLERQLPGPAAAAHPFFQQPPEA